MTVIVLLVGVCVWGALGHIDSTVQAAVVSDGDSAICLVPQEALEGVDYSQGALFFIEKKAAEKQNVAWFEKDLQKLFKYGVHEFYKYPDESSKGDSSSKDKSSSDKDNDQETVVQMVKNDINS